MAERPICGHPTTVSDSQLVLGAARHPTCHSEGAREVDLHSL